MLTCDRCSQVKDDIVEDINMVFGHPAQQLKQNICHDCIEFMDRSTYFVYDKDKKEIRTLPHAFKDDPILKWQKDNHCIDIGKFSRMNEEELREVIVALNKLRLEAERDRYDALVEVGLLKDEIKKLKEPVAV